MLLVQLDIPLAMVSCVCMFVLDQLDTEVLIKYKIQSILLTV
jgi:hypothetical protein